MPPVRAISVCALVLLAGGLGACDSPVSEGRPLRVSATIGGTGLSPGQFVYPRAIDASGDRVWVIDKTARVQGFDLATGELVGGFRMPELTLGKPTGVTLAPGPDGREAIYVPDTHYHRVLIYEPPAPGGAPTLLASFGEYGDGPGQFVYPTDVAVMVGADGLPERIYVSEYGGNDRISVFDGSYAFQFSFGSPGTGPGAEFNRPQSIGIDGSLGELVVTDASNHRVGRFTLDGELVGWLGGVGAGPGEFAYPYGLALPGNGTALVSEFGNGRVQHVDLRSGECLGLYGTPGRGEGELMNPWGVAVAGEEVYVLDSGIDQVVSFEAPRRAGKVSG
jgi:hypothetical protein